VLCVGDATPVVCALWKAGLVWNDPAALLSDQVIAVEATSNSKKLMRHIESKFPGLKFLQGQFEIILILNAAEVQGLGPFSS
jgi:hypothetical protein